LTGHFTLPAQKGMDKEVRMLCDKWGVDAVRDSDGTALSQEILEIGPDIYLRYASYGPIRPGRKSIPINGHAEISYLLSGYL